MKYLFVFLFAICGNFLFAQNDLSLFEYKSKPEIKPFYLLVYQSFEDFLHVSGGAASASKRWKTKSVVFESEKELFDFLNYSDNLYLGGERKYTRLRESQIVGIWDLQSAEKIKIKLKSETIKKEKEVIIESEEWVNKWFEKSEN